MVIDNQLNFYEHAWKVENGQGKLEFGQGKVRELSGNFIFAVLWEPCIIVTLILIVTLPVRFFVHNYLIRVYTICACIFTVRQLIVTIVGFTSSTAPD